MKLVTFEHAGQLRLGALQSTGTAEKIVDLNNLDSRLPADMLKLLQGGPAVLDQAKKALAALPAGVGLDRSAVTLKAPLPHPGKILCIGQNYLEHAKESGNTRSPYPIVFSKYDNSVIGPDAPIILPKVVAKPDYEGELGVVIGRKGRSIPESEALAYVGGYLALNDVSARDWQNRTSQWIMGKACDTFCPMGPALVTADEIADPQDLRIRTIIGGEELQNGWTGDMIYPISFLISYISQVITLEPGDVIATGTPPGVGFARVPPRWLVPGDVVRIEIDHVGILENPVQAEI